MKKAVEHPDVRNFVTEKVGDSTLHVPNRMEVNGEIAGMVEALFTGHVHTGGN